MTRMESTADALDPDKMTSKELYDHFNKLLVGQAQDIETRFADQADKIDGLETSFTTQLEAKFQKLLGRLPPPAPAAPPRRHLVPPANVGRARRVAHYAPAAAGVAAPHDAYEGDDDLVADTEAEGEVVQQPPGRPRALNRNVRAPPVRDDDHVAKLKLVVPPFDGRYNPDAYLTWELEVEQRFACLNYPEDRRVCAATCEFTGFASVWWSEHCRIIMLIFLLLGLL